MKNSLRTIGGYIASFTKVCLLAPVVLAKVVTDTALQLYIAFFYALYNEKEKSASVMNEVIDKMD